MTEAEWLASQDPGPMLVFLGRKADSRKLRLFAVACVRRLSRLLDDERSRRALDVAEQFADRGKKGPPSRKELRQTELEAWRVGHALNGGPDSARYNAAEAATEAAAYNAVGAARRSAEHITLGVFPVPGLRQTEERAAQASLLLCVFGNPWRPTTPDPAWLTPAVTSLAAAAYNERTLPAATLEVARLAVLADALEEAGCTEQALLDHLRLPGPHVRGCWAVDLLLAEKRAVQGAMPLDLRRDCADIYAYVKDRIRTFDPTNNRGPGKGGPVKQIDVGYECDQSAWVVVVFDTRPDAEWDGEWTGYIEERNELARPHWLQALKTLVKRSISLILPDGSRMEIPAVGSAQARYEQFGEVLGEMIKAVLLQARADGVFASLPKAADCELGVEHFNGAYGWPAYESRRQENLAEPGTRPIRGI
jgi:hypothetical protein